MCPCSPAVTASRHQDFPVTIKAGSSAFKIYKETKPSGECYRVCYYFGGKRERLTFPSLEEARTEARLNAALLARGDSAALELTGQDRPVYGSAIDAVRPFNVPLDASAFEYAEAQQILGNRSLLEAKYLIIAVWTVQFLPPTGPLVEEALEEAVEVDV